MPKPIAISIAGTGFIGRGLVLALEHCRDLRLHRVLTRRPPESMTGFPRADRLTRDVEQALDGADMLVEVSGDVMHAAYVVDRALTAGLPVVTMNAEFHATVGSYFVSKGLLTEAHGDQPGALAALHEEAVQAGFTPLVYGNRKGFYNPDPTLVEMQKWSKIQGISLEQVTAATDGTKIHIEQAMVANGLGATILQDGLTGEPCDTLPEGGAKLAEQAAKLGRPVCDYVIAPKAPAGVFLTGTHVREQAAALEYFKFGPGPYYTLVHNYHLCHLEMPRTIRRVRDAMLLHGRNAASHGAVLLNNSASPTISVATIAKRDLPAGHRIHRAIGSFDFRGSAVRMASHPDHIPIGLLSDCTLRRAVSRGQELTFADVDLPDSLALRAWRDITRGQSAGRTAGAASVGR